MKGTQMCIGYFWLFTKASWRYYYVLLFSFVSSLKKVVNQRLCMIVRFIYREMLVKQLIFSFTDLFSILKKIEEKEEACLDVCIGYPCSCRLILWIICTRQSMLLIMA